MSNKKRPSGPETSEVLVVGEVIENRWVVQKVLGRGGFGAVYEVHDKQTGRQEAMKIELQEQDFRTLKLEVVVLKELNAKNARHICQILGMGKKKSYCYIIMTLVGPSFQSMLQALKVKFPAGDTKFGLRSVVHLSKTSLEALQDCHKIGYIHRDIKPQNYATGRAPEYRRVFLLDFGMSRKYVHVDGTQRRPREKAQFRGTLFYASVAALNGEDQAPRDDLWSWFFMLIRMTAGRLPWRNCLPPRDMPMSQQARYYATLKANLISQPNTFLTGCPQEFGPILSYLNTMTYGSKIDYALCYKQLDAIMKRLQYTEATPLDWEVAGEHHVAASRAAAHPMMPDPTNKHISAVQPSNK